MERSLVLNRLRALADAFSRLAGSGSPSSSPRETTLCDEAGKLVMLAHRRGWLNIPGLAELVQWVENPPARDPKLEATLCACASNLFREVAGLNQVPVVVDDKLRIVGPTCGGVLPGLYPDALPGYESRRSDAGGTLCEHYAVVCRTIADSISIGTRGEEKQEHAVEPLTHRAECVYREIIENGPVMGRQITVRTGIDQSTLTKEIIPELKRLRGILNKRGAGYYSPRHYHPQ